MSVIIAFSGWKRSGKDSCASYLREVHGFRRLGFADVLKQMVCSEFDIPFSDMYDDSKKELALPQYPIFSKDATSRTLNDLLYKEFRTSDGQQPDFVHTSPDTGQMFAVSGRDLKPLFHSIRSLCILKGSVNRSVDSDYWVNRAVQHLEDDQSYVISDLRYKSEIEAIKKRLGPGDMFFTVRVNRFETSPSNDPSERELDDFKFDYVIKNTSTLTDLEYSLETIVCNIKRVWSMYGSL